MPGAGLAPQKPLYFVCDVGVVVVGRERVIVVVVQLTCLDELRSAKEGVGVAGLVGVQQPLLGLEILESW